MGDNITDFVSADPWFRPEATRIEEARAFLSGELASCDALDVRDEETVSVFFSPEGGLQARCPRCGKELTEQAIVDWFNADYGEDGGFRLAPRTMACCDSLVALNELTSERLFAFARFGIQVMNPKWKFQEALPSQLAVDEMVGNLDWIRAARDEWLARHSKWSADLIAGEKEIALRLAPILGCAIILVYEHI